MRLRASVALRILVYLNDAQVRSMDLMRWHGHDQFSMPRLIRVEKKTAKTCISIRSKQGHHQRGAHRSGSGSLIDIPRLKGGRDRARQGSQPLPCLCMMSQRPPDPSCSLEQPHQAHAARCGKGSHVEHPRKCFPLQTRRSPHWCLPELSCSMAAVRAYAGWYACGEGAHARASSVKAPASGGWALRQGCWRSVCCPWEA